MKLSKSFILLIRSIYILGVSADTSKESAWYRNDQWTKDAINKKVKAVHEKNWGAVGGAYGDGETEVLFDTINQYKKEVGGKNALVIGSETPWVEAILLAVGAKHVTTLEYNRIISTHPQVYKRCLCFSIVPNFLNLYIYI